ncbi:DnaD domain protein [Clostridium sp. D2Q-14]|uniref:DnaD domain-containing protein n=1 Tax=Anaeromonas gelatinilytica TaxID=2683194 RepID=UPI00193B3580|nr:DnaD domain protein [Anaeromonas gelatinilytica]MBS4534425.1 DnaD domain protein [Anaeromonas gelatinilytica]
MSFFIETTDIDLGDTTIENIFINDFMPMAHGTYVKVYLLGYKYAKDMDDNIRVDNRTIAKHLNIPLGDVLNAWDFWESKGIIRKKIENEGNDIDYTVEFLNLKQLYINNVIKPKAANENTYNKKNNFNKPYTATADELLEAKNSPAINNMFNEIRTALRRYITPNESKRIYEWIDNFNMSPDVIVRAFQFSVENKNNRRISFVEGIIKNWYADGITNIENLDEYMSKNDQKFYRYNKILRYLGLKGLASEPQKKYINKWFDEWNFNMDLVLLACDETTKISEISFDYIDGVLKNWFNANINSIEDLEKRKEDFKLNKKNNSKKNTTISKNKKIYTQFHNFQQRTTKYSADELEKKIKKKFEAKINS